VARAALAAAHELGTLLLPAGAAFREDRGGAEAAFVGRCARERGLAVAGQGHGGTELTGAGLIRAGELRALLHPSARFPLQHEDRARAFGVLARADERRLAVGREGDAAPEQAFAVLACAGDLRPVRRPRFTRAGERPRGPLACFVGEAADQRGRAVRGQGDAAPELRGSLLFFACESGLQSPRRAAAAAHEHPRRPDLFRVAGIADQRGVAVG
jgi:hypothetical protein